MGSNPIKSTKFYIMNKFYTQTISKELLNAIAKKGFPYKTIPVGYNVFEQGGGYPEYATVIPTYAEVLDWLLDNGYEMSISKLNEGRDWSCQVLSWRGPAYMDDFKEVFEENFSDALEQAILLAIEFIEPLQAENVSNGTDSY